MVKDEKLVFIDYGFGDGCGFGGIELVAKIKF